MSPRRARRLKTSVAIVAILAQLGAAVTPAAAFCGFYVAKADSKLFNKASKVVLSWDSGKTAVTMANDYEGDPKEFAIVVPMPTFIERKQIGVVDMKTIDHLDAFTAPRLVEYRDPDPCAPAIAMDSAGFGGRPMAAPASAQLERAKAYRGVTVEATYDVAEYDVSILSAKESNGLVDFLGDNGYRLPEGAEAVLGSYIKQRMHFFIAKVNLKRLQQSGSSYLRPLQVRYETAKFMLPLRLGTVNADGPQDLVVFALTKKGRIEASNYRTVKMPSNVDVPLFVKDDFTNFYKATFEHAVAREGMHGVFVEYAWDMGWCDPCAAAPMSKAELTELGALWDGGDGDTIANRFQPVPRNGNDPFVTRLHVRYDAKSFPEDLSLTETHDRGNFQGRYILHHAFVGPAACTAAAKYRDELQARFQKEAMNLADLTGWPQQAIETRMRATGEPLRGR